jgi:hypothetical protein
MLSDPNIVVIPALRDSCHHYLSRFRRFAPEIAVNIVRRRFPELSFSHVLETLRECDGDPILASVRLRHAGRRRGADNPDRALDVPDGVDPFAELPPWDLNHSMDDLI